jgi:DNA-directed RNA polymerase subunit alpha
LTTTFGRFTAEPFERGFGTTVGNSLRRILLSSLEGAAITSVKIAGVTHAFTSLPGVNEDVTDIILNIKKLVVSMEGDGAKTMRLLAEGPGEVTPDLIEADASIQIHNPETVLATLTEKKEFAAEFTVEKGRGYLPASEQWAKIDEQEIGLIPVDAIFSPVLRVRYRVEDTRVGQRTNYDRLILDIWTNGTITPEMALVEASKILRKHLNPFVMYDNEGEETVPTNIANEPDAELELIRKVNMPISELDLTVRVSNCLESAKIKFVHELVRKTENDMLCLRAFGRTSLRELKKSLEDEGLGLGMVMPEGFKPATSDSHA